MHFNNTFTLQDQIKLRCTKLSYLHEYIGGRRNLSLHNSIKDSHQSVQGEGLWTKHVVVGLKNKSSRCLSKIVIISSFQKTINVILPRISIYLTIIFKVSIFLKHERCLFISKHYFPKYLLVNVQFQHPMQFNCITCI